MKKLLTYLICSIYKALAKRAGTRDVQRKLNPFHANTQLTAVPVSVPQRACTHVVYTKL